MFPRAAAAADADMTEADLAEIQSLVELGFPPPPAADFIHGDTIEGCKITRGVYRDRGHFYARWMVHCPLRHCKHLDGSGRSCQKYRNTMAAQTTRFGISEVYVFLAVWIRKSHDKTNRKAHVDYRPTDKQIADYVAERGWSI